ncbi:hypothetical protein A7981_01700 [Methylovorus sp. MM2]|uniref:SdrD B-like domain-containing protein n=1 Tax=Methylovorus sp. MM2 TaxID=1848038 RepID=UPI0007E03A76|nr:SdrD B-like domain-containing protein [Methylovorus sp. MM2]OAM52229.1 hypothetical protein A7981_01700 [Methylovorus sp. MM2]
MQKRGSIQTLSALKASFDRIIKAPNKHSLKQTPQQLPYRAQKKFKWVLLALLMSFTLPAFAAVDILIPSFTDLPDPAARGGIVTYTIVIDNNGDDPASAVVVNIPLPATTLYQSATVDDGISTCSEAAGTVTCNLGTLTGTASGGSAKTITLQIKTTASTGSTINLSATTSTASAESNAANNTESQNTTINNGADVYATVIGSPDPVTGGGNVTWAISGGNNGPNTATNTSVSITLPSTLTYVSASGGGFSCSLAGNVVTCNGPTLINGSTFSGLNLITKVSGASSGTVTLNPNITSAVTDPDTANNSPTGSVTINAGSDLRITQNTPNPTPGISGQPVTFTLNPANLGPSNATNGVTATYQLPAGFTYVSATPTGANWSCSPSGSPTLVTCVNSGTFNANRTDTISIVATAPTVTNIQSYNNITATIAHNAGNPPDPVASNNTSTVDLNISPAGAGLSIFKNRSPDPVAAGSNITSTLRVNNTGPNSAAANTIVVTDTFTTANETFVSASGTNWSCAAPIAAGANTSVSCTYTGILANGADTNNLSIITTATGAAATATNNAGVACTVGAQCWFAIPTAAASVDVTQLTNSINLSLTKSATTVGGVPATLEFNESTLTYSLVLTNVATPDNVNASNIVVSDLIPGYLSAHLPEYAASGITAISSSAKFSCATGETVTCTQQAGVTNELAPGESVTFTIQASRPLLDGNYTNRASAYSTTQGDIDRSNNEATFDIAIEPIADVQMVSKTLSSGTVKAGTNATYVLTFKNNGPSQAANVVVTDVFTLNAADPGFTVLSVTPTGSTTCTGLVAGTSYPSGTPTLNCSVGTLNSDGEQTVTIVIRPNWKTGQVAGATWTIPNTATITTSTKENSAGTDNGNNAQNQTLTVDAADIDLLINNIDNVDPLGFDPTSGGDNANNNVIYTINMVNNGPSLASGLKFTYTITPPVGKTIRFLGDSDTIGGNPTAAPICNNVGSTVTGGSALTVTCTYPNGSDTIAADATRNRFLTIRVLTAPNAGGDSYPSLAQISANETDNNASNNSEGETTTVRVRVDLALSKTPSLSTVQINQPFNWTLVVTNNGPGDSPLTSLTDTLPAGMEFSGAAPSWINNTTNATGTCNMAGQILSCGFGALANASTITLTVPVRIVTAPLSGTLQNCATAKTSEADPSQVNSSQVCTSVTVQKSSVAGNVYGDVNNNGVLDASENGIPNVTVTLTGTDVYGNAISRNTTSTVNGSYLFDNLPPSNASGYTLVETQPADYTDGQDTLGSAGGTVVTNDQLRLVLPANTAATAYNFGELSVSLSGTVFVDNDNDGLFDPAEPGIPGTTLTLSGTTATGNNICTVIPSCTVQTAANGSWIFSGLPLSNGAGYTVIETQPVGYNDGGDQVGNIGQIGAHINDRFTVNLATSGVNGTGYNFGEIVNSAGVANVSGHVWLDLNHDRIFDSGSPSVDQPQNGWIVELLKNGTLIATEITRQISGINGAYAFTNIPAGSGYKIQFRHPTTGLIYGQARPNEDGASYTNGVPNTTTNPAGATNTDGSLSGLTLDVGDNILEQSLPLDPAGVVYDAVTRLAVAGATVTISGPAGFNPAIHVVGGTASQTTGADGIYQFLLNPGSPAGVYTLTITTYPEGYAPIPSTMIPVCTATLTVTNTSDPSLVQQNNGAPAVGVTAHNPATCTATTADGSFANGFGTTTTRYYFNFDLDAASRNIINNHIPIDPVLGGALIISKTTPLVNVTKGDLVPYTITATNTLAAALSNINIQDRLPPGFKYRSGSATLNGNALEPTIAGRDLTWANQNFTAGEKKTYKLMLVVGTGVGEGQYINQAWALNNLLGTLVSNVANATVRVNPDPTFDCSDIIGKVFDDKNANGYQDEGEPGIANVRVVTVRGLLITTDAEGRFHVTCADIPDSDHGANFVMKLDERTLPSGYRMTTENPRDVRVTRGKMVKLNFGATVHRVIRIDLNAGAFADNQSSLLPEWQQSLPALCDRLAERPSVLRIAYDPKNSDAALAKKRLDAVADAIRTLWKQKAKDNKQDPPAYPLVIETALEAQP